MFQYMDREEYTRCIAFTNQDEALEYIKEGVDSGLFEESDIIFKGNPYYIHPNFLRTIYLRIFASDKNVFFKDYVTGGDINYNPTLDTRFRGGVSFQNNYWLTFTSLHYSLNRPEIIVIIKKTEWDQE